MRKGVINENFIQNMIYIIYDIYHILYYNECK